MSSLLSRRTRRGSEAHTPQSSSSSRRQSKTVSLSASSDQLDDWSSGFTGLVDLDRRMRELALAQSESTATDASMNQTYGTAYTKHRQNSDSSRKTDSTSSIFSGLSIPSSATTPSLGNFGSDGWTTASSRSLVDLSPSLLSKRRASANAPDAYDNPMMSTRLASLPLPLSPFGTVRLMNSPVAHLHGKEHDALTPRPLHDVEDVMTPGTAAAATWTETPTPGYFAPTHTPQSKKQTAKRTSQPAKPCVAELSSLDEQTLAFDLESKNVESAYHDSGLPNSYALRRSAQSLAFGLRFKMMKAGRKLKRSSQGAVDHFSHTLERESNELPANTSAIATVHP